MLALIRHLVVLQCFFAAVSAKKAASKVLTVDLPGISCDVCEIAVETLFSEVKEMRKVAPYNKVEELEVQKVIEEMCNSDSASGEWIRHLDITTLEKNDKSYAKIGVPGGIAKCESECLTVARSCDNLFDTEIDQDDLSAILYKNKHSLERLTVILDPVCLFVWIILIN